MITIPSPRMPASNEVMSTMIHEMRIDNEVNQRSPSTAVAIVLWLILGTVGAHRFYLGRHESGAVMAFLWVAGWAWLYAVVIGVDMAGSLAPAIGMLIVVSAWALIDVAWIPHFVRAKRAEIRREIEGE